jgi:hypothetical protein
LGLYFIKCTTFRTCTGYIGPQPPKPGFEPGPWRLEGSWRNGCWPVTTRTFATKQSSVPRPKVWTQISLDAAVLRTMADLKTIPCSLLPVAWITELSHQLRNWATSSGNQLFECGLPPLPKFYIVWCLNLISWLKAVCHPLLVRWPDPRHVWAICKTVLHPPVCNIVAFKRAIFKF